MNLAGPLCLLFALSGAAALLFEVLWFRQAGFVLGNTVWAASLVTAGFMAGLALGNALVIRRGAGIERPLRAYALLECAIAASGVALVAGLPALAVQAAGWWGGLDPGFGQNAARLGAAFALLLVPSSAMGATLPLLSRALGAVDPNFGRVLGRLYGWNTLGAVAGAMAGEVALIELFGVRGTAVVAASLNLAAAGGALLIERRLPASPPRVPDAEAAGAGWRAPAATFLAGFVLLGLEVVWFRFLQLFITATTLTFAAMLAVVLLGIAAGSLIAAAWLARRPGDYRAAPLVALAAAAAAVLSYAAFSPELPGRGNAIVTDLGGVIALCVRLMLPVCLLSGILFTFLGKAVQARAGEETRATGILTLANTVGAMLGALVAGFALLPAAGVERALFVLAAAYLVAAAVAPGGAFAARAPAWRAAGWGLAVLIVALFPFGLMKGRWLRVVAERWQGDGSRLVAVKEGLTETVLLFRRDALGQPLSWRLVTNGLGMSATNHIAHRYMGLFVWMPVAMHPAPRTALVISYGLGTTARALVDTRELARIDVVDVSADVLATSGGVWPRPSADPLRDPRVRVHVEDGRFFLLTTRERFDIITGEPPPPKMAGIASLYSREYFRLMHDRLAEGGIATYWLPVYHFKAPEALSVVKAFCDAFTDCSLWSGVGPEWILMGSRGARGPVSEERFTRQWRDPVVAARLLEAGLDSPARLAATFLGDAWSLQPLLANVPALVDDRPHLLDPRVLAPPTEPLYVALLAPGPAAKRFEASPVVKVMVPAAVRESAQAAFPAQAHVNRMGWMDDRPPPLAEVFGAIVEGPAAAALWLLGTSREEVEIAARVAASGAASPEADEILGLDALSRRDYAGAEQLLARAEPHAGHAARIRQLRVLACGLAGDAAGAEHLAAEAGPLRGNPSGTPEDWAWLDRRFGGAP